MSDALNIFAIERAKVQAGKFVDLIDRNLSPTEVSIAFGIALGSTARLTTDPDTGLRLAFRTAIGVVSGEVFDSAPPP